MSAEVLRYGLFVGLGAIVGLAIRHRESARLGYHLDPRYRLVGVGSLFGGVLGSKLGMAMYGAPISLLGPSGTDFGGKTILGALAGGVIVGELTKWILRVRYSTGDALAVALPAAQAIGRVGCHLAGCCYGTAATPPLLGAVDVHGASRHPVALWESAGCALLALVLYRLRGSVTTPGLLFRAYVGCYCALRGALEGFRGDSVSVAGPLTAGQVVCAIGISWAVVDAIVRARRADRTRERAGSSTP